MAAAVGMQVDANTLALWRFDEASGDAIDQTGTYLLSYSATDPGSTPAIVNQARVITTHVTSSRFRNLGDAAMRALIAVAPACWTLEAMVRYTDGQAVLFALQTEANAFWGILWRIVGGVVYIGGAGSAPGYTEIPFWTAEQTPVAQRTIPTDQWTYIAITFNRTPTLGDFATFYMHGAVMSSQPLGFNTANLPNGEVLVGDYFATPFNYALPVTTFAIDELRVSNVARSAYEIKLQYDLYFPPTQVLQSQPSTQIAGGQGSQQNMNMFPKLRGGPGTELLSRVQDNIASVLNPLASAVSQTPIMGAPPPNWIAPDLLNGFANTGTPLSVAGFHKDALSYVHVRGSLTNAAGVAAGTSIFLLPAGCRPASTLRFSVRGTAGAVQSVIVGASGLITNDIIIAVNGTIDISFTFLAEQ